MLTRQMQATGAGVSVCPFEPFWAHKGMWTSVLAVATQIEFEAEKEKSSWVPFRIMQTETKGLSLVRPAH